jgi:hypothetical protein
MACTYIALRDKGRLFLSAWNDKAFMKWNKDLSNRTDFEIGILENVSATSLQQITGWLEYMYITLLLVTTDHMDDIINGKENNEAIYTFSHTDEIGETAWFYISIFNNDLDDFIYHFIPYDPKTEMYLTRLDQAGILNTLKPVGKISKSDLEEWTRLIDDLFRIQSNVWTLGISPDRWKEAFGEEDKYYMRAFDLNLMELQCINLRKLDFQPLQGHTVLELYQAMDNMTI